MSYDLIQRLLLWGGRLKFCSVLQVQLEMAGINELMSALSSDADLREKLSNATTPQAAVDSAKAAGFTVTAQELLEAYKNKMGAMSDSELSSVAGGKNDNHYHHN